MAVVVGRDVHGRLSRMTGTTRSYGDEQADEFDDAADHGLVDPAVREAWGALLLPLVPRPGSDVADLGCGTGSFSLLLGSAGHRVTGLDFSERMVDIARAKADRTGHHETPERVPGSGARARVFAACPPAVPRTSCWCINRQEGSWIKCLTDRDTPNRPTTQRFDSEI